MKDPYEVQRQACLEKGGHEKVKGHNICCCDDNVSVSGGAPLEEQKTQVERWKEEIEENRKVISDCGCDTILGLCFDCENREEKIDELMELISQATQPIHPRHPTGTFADDVKMCGCGEVATLGGAEVEVAGVCHRYNKPCYVYKKVTLLDKIKKILNKITK